jgi:DNA-binding GntR family transcriptional regulator
MDQPLLALLERADPPESPPARGATVEYIVSRIRDDIMSARLTAGAHLVENDLTSRFAVSRGPVREALRRLAADGLIDHIAHRGAWVRSLNRETLREVFQIRVELEALSAQLAAANREPRRVTRFEAAIRPIHGERPRLERDYLVEDQMFHEAVLALGGNAQLWEITHRLNTPVVMTQAARAPSLEALEDAAREHRIIAAAILSGDPAAAGGAMRAHLERAAALALVED